MTKIVNNDKYTYVRRKVRGEDGRVRYSATCNDAVARALTGMTKQDLVKVMFDNRLGDRLERHLDKNLGHFRMILGQALRGLVRRNVPITVRGVQILALDQRIHLPPFWREESYIHRNTD